ncbi:hypothetical protein Tco_0320893 [Tanacetum coccineum]
MFLHHLLKSIIKICSKAFFNSSWVVESGAVVVKIVASVVVGVGIGVDCYGRGMNGEIGGGMVIAGAVEDLGITETCTGMLSKLRNLVAQSDEIEELCSGT